MKVTLLKCFVVLGAGACGALPTDPAVAPGSSSGATVASSQGGGVRSSSAAAGGSSAVVTASSAAAGSSRGPRSSSQGTVGSSSQGMVASSAMGTSSSRRSRSSSAPAASSGGTASSTGTGGACGVVGYGQVMGIISTNCVSCHPGQSVALTSYNAGLAPANNGSCAGMNLWECSSIRMSNGSMPPGGGATTADKNTMAAWIAQGFPQNTCAPDGGVIAPPDAGPPPPPVDAGPPTCSTNSRWTGRDNGSSNMHPGWDCIHCHTDQGRANGQNYTAGGTVQGAIHDDNDCNGITGVTVSITDNAGVVSTQTTNSAGNFHFNTRFAYPVHISITNAGVTRTMSTAVSPPAGLTGIRCASCHTIYGTQGTAGRIIP